MLRWAGSVSTFMGYLVKDTGVLSGTSLGSSGSSCPALGSGLSILENGLASDWADAPPDPPYIGSFLPFGDGLTHDRRFAPIHTYAAAGAWKLGIEGLAESVTLQCFQIKFRLAPIGAP